MDRQAREAGESRRGLTWKDNKRSKFEILEYTETNSGKETHSLATRPASSRFKNEVRKEPILERIDPRSIAPLASVGTITCTIVDEADGALDDAVTEGVGIWRATCS